MTAVMLWLLVNIGSTGGRAPLASSVIERFPTALECARVLNSIRASAGERDEPPRMRCIQATVIR